MLPFVEGLDVFPHVVDLRFPGLTIGEEAVAGLFLVPSAPPPFVRRDLLDLVAEVVSGPRVRQKELVVSARKGVSLVGELLPKLPAAFCTCDADRLALSSSLAGNIPSLGHVQ